MKKTNKNDLSNKIIDEQTLHNMNNVINNKVNDVQMNKDFQGRKHDNDIDFTNIDIRQELDFAVIKEKPDSYSSDEYEESNRKDTFNNNRHLSNNTNKAAGDKRTKNMGNRNHNHQNVKGNYKSVNERECKEYDKMNEED